MFQSYQVIKIIFLVGLVCSLISCNDIAKQQELCASSSNETFELLKENIDKKDIITVKQLCEEPETYIDTIFGNLNKPTIEFISEQPDGAFGIKKIGSADVYYTRVLNSDTTIAIKAVIIQQKGNCYKIINIANVDTLKEKKAR
jgi:hypothetical protein